MFIYYFDCISKIQSLLKRNMYKVLLAIVKYALMLYIFHFFLRIGLYRHALLKMPPINTLDTKQLLNNSTSLTQRSQIINRLEDLTAIPILGKLYQQEMIYQLYILQRYQEARALVQKILSSPFNQKSFKLWYFKAQTEILLNLLEEGEYSLTKASMYAKKRYQNSLIEELGDTLTKYKEIQDANKIVFESTGTYMKKSQAQKYLQEKEKMERENL